MTRRMGILALEALHQEKQSGILDPALMPTGDEEVTAEIDGLSKYLPGQTAAGPIGSGSPDATPVALATEAEGPAATQEPPVEGKPEGEAAQPPAEAGEEGEAGAPGAEGEGDATPDAAEEGGDPAQEGAPEGEADPTAAVDATDPAVDTGGEVGGEEPGGEEDPATKEIKLPDLDALEVDKVADEIVERQEAETQASQDAIGESELLVQALESMHRELASGQVLSQERLQVFSGVLQEARELLGAEAPWQLGMEGYQEGQPLSQELVMEGFVDTLRNIWKQLLAFMKRMFDACRARLKVWYQGLDREIEMTKQLTRKLLQDTRRGGENSDLNRNLTLINTEQYVSLPVAARFLTKAGAQSVGDAYVKEFDIFLSLAKQWKTFDYFLDPSWKQGLTAGFDALGNGDGGAAMAKIFNTSALTPLEFTSLNANDFKDLVLQKDERLVGVKDMLGGFVIAQLLPGRRFAVSGLESLKQFQKWRCLEERDDTITEGSTGSMRRLADQEVVGISRKMVEIHAQVKNYYSLDRKLKMFEDHIGAVGEFIAENQSGMSADVMEGMNLTVGAMTTVVTNIKSLVDSYPGYCINVMRAYNAYLKALIVRDEQVKAEYTGSRDDAAKAKEEPKAAKGPGQGNGSGANQNARQAVPGKNGMRATGVGVTP